MLAYYDHFAKTTTFLKQRLLLKRISLGRHKIDSNNRMIQLTDVICELVYWNQQYYNFTIIG